MGEVKFLLSALAFTALCMYCTNRTQSTTKTLTVYARVLSVDTTTHVWDGIMFVEDTTHYFVIPRGSFPLLQTGAQITIQYNGKPD